MVVADFMIEGHFARHVKRMRKLYAERRKALISALRTFFGDEIVLDVPLGGMHVIARFVAREDDVAMAARAQRAGSPQLGGACTGLSRRRTDGRFATGDRVRGQASCGHHAVQAEAEAGARLSEFDRHSFLVTAR
jgi:hypothetical protein